MKLSNYFKASLLFFTATSAFAEQKDPYDPIIELRTRAGEDRNIHESIINIPVLQTKDKLLFTDFRTMADSDSSQELNLGLAYRQAFNDKFIAGLYGFYDSRTSTNNFEYRQATFGAEILTPNYDLRFNRYLPQDEENHISGSGTADFTSGSFLVSSSIEKPYGGYDYEVGRKIPTNWFLGEKKSKNIDLRAFAGAYKFTAGAGFEDIEGPRARLDLTFLNPIKAIKGLEFKLRAQYQDDDVRGGQNAIMASVRIPFGASKSRNLSNKNIYSRMQNIIERDVDIVSNVGTTTPTAATSVTFDGSTFDSSNINVVNSLSELQSKTTSGGDAARNTLVVLGSDITTTSSDHTSSNLITLQSGQKLIGGESIVANVNGIQVVVNSPPRPTITNTSAGPGFDGHSSAGSITDSTTIAMGNDSTVSGINFIGGLSAIGATNVAGITIKNSNISKTYSSGISLDGNPDNNTNREIGEFSLARVVSTTSGNIDISNVRFGTNNANTFGDLNISDYSGIININNTHFESSAQGSLSFFNVDNSTLNLSNLSVASLSDSEEFIDISYTDTITANISDISVHGNFAGSAIDISNNADLTFNYRGSLNLTGSYDDEAFFVAERNTNDTVINVYSDITFAAQVGVREFIKVSDNSGSTSTKVNIFGDITTQPATFNNALNFSTRNGSGNEVNILGDLNLQSPGKGNIINVSVKNATFNLSGTTNINKAGDGSAISLTLDNSTANLTNTINLTNIFSGSDGAIKASLRNSSELNISGTTTINSVSESNGINISSDASSTTNLTGNTFITNIFGSSGNGLRIEGGTYKIQNLTIGNVANNPVSINGSSTAVTINNESETVNVTGSSSSECSVDSSSTLTGTLIVGSTTCAVESGVLE